MRRVLAVASKAAIVQNVEHLVQSSEHLVQSNESHALHANLSRLPWDDLKLFLCVSDASSFRMASRQSKMSINTVRSRMERLEIAYGAPLLDRSYRGVTLTEAGARLRRTALTMKSDVTLGIDGPTHSGLISPNELRIGATEALGSGWLTPRMLDLQKLHPDLTVCLMCENDVERDRSGEVDVALSWIMPKNADLIVSKLATLHFMPFASHRYLAEHGTPETVDELINHRFIEQVTPGAKSHLLDNLVGSDRPPGFLPIRSNSSIAVFWAVASGAGIAFMPTYSLAITRKIVPIDLPFQLKFDIFYSYHAAARHDPAIRSTIEWLKAIFNPRLYPWFRSEFIHPSLFLEGECESNVIRLFEPFLEKI
jgi:DNA-binding transcriptional LysR family regulator